MTWTKLAHIRVPGIPRPQGKLITRSVRGRGIGHMPVHVERHRQKVAWAAKRAWDHPVRFDGPIWLEAVFSFTRPQSQMGTGRNKGIPKPWAPTHHIQTPDVDKLCRLVLDALEQAHVIRNDSQVTILEGRKQWHTEPETHLTVWGWDTDADC